MSEIIPNSTPRDRVAECHMRAAEDRVRAGSMDTGNGRRKFEHSAASWDQRAELLGRLDASFNKRERLDAEAERFHSARGNRHLAEAAGLEVWDGDGGAPVSPRPSGERVEAGRIDGTRTIEVI